MHLGYIFFFCSFLASIAFSLVLPPLSLFSFTFLSMHKLPSPLPVSRLQAPEALLCLGRGGSAWLQFHPHVECILISCFQGFIYSCSEISKFRFHMCFHPVKCLLKNNSLGLTLVLWFYSAVRVSVWREFHCRICSTPCIQFGASSYPGPGAWESQEAGRKGVGPLWVSLSKSTCFSIFCEGCSL